VLDKGWKNHEASIPKPVLSSRYLLHVQTIPKVIAFQDRANDGQKAGSKRRIVKRVGELTQATSGVWDKTTLTKFAPSYVPFETTGPAKLLPEAEHTLGSHFHAVQSANGETQIVDLSGNQDLFRIVAIYP